MMSKHLGLSVGSMMVHMEFCRVFGDSTNACTCTLSNIRCLILQKTISYTPSFTAHTTLYYKYVYLNASPFECFTNMLCRLDFLK